MSSGGDWSERVEGELRAGEITFQADAVRLAPASGSFVGVFEDHASPYAACL